MSNQADWKYCHRCGSQLPPAWEEPRCPHCGAIPPEGSAYCVLCGAPLRTETAPTVPATAPGLEPSRREGRPSTMIVLGILVAAIVVLSMLLVTGAGDSLMGRHTYTGSSPPYTNVTLYGVKDFLVLNLPSGGSEAVVSSVVPKGFPIFLPTGATANITLGDSNPFTNYSLTIDSIMIETPFSGSLTFPLTPVTIPPEGSVLLKFTVTVPSTPGIYELSMDETATLS